MANKTKTVAVRVTEEQEQKILSSGITPSEYVRKALSCYDDFMDIQDVLNNLAKTACKEEKLHDKLELRLLELFQEDVTIEVCTSRGDNGYSYEIEIYVDSWNVQIKKQMEQLFGCEVEESFGRFKVVLEGNYDNL